MRLGYFILAHAGLTDIASLSWWCHDNTLLIQYNVTPGRRASISPRNHQHSRAIAPNTIEECHQRQKCYRAQWYHIFLHNTASVVKRRFHSPPSHAHSYCHTISLSFGMDGRCYSPPNILQEFTLVRAFSFETVKILFAFAVIPDL